MTAPVKMDKVTQEIEIFLNINERDTERFRRKYESIPKEMEMTIQERTKGRFPVEFGDIWFVNLGVNVGSEMDKVRPVIIASGNGHFNTFSSLITVIPVTKSDCKYSSQFTVDGNNFVMKEDAFEGDKPVRGVAKAEQIRSVSKGRFLYKMGHLNKKGLAQLRLALKNHMELG